MEPEEFLDRLSKLTNIYLLTWLFSLFLNAGSAYAHRKKDKDGRPLGTKKRDVNPKNIMIGQEAENSPTLESRKHWTLCITRKVMLSRQTYLSHKHDEVTDSRADLFGCGIVS